jgi:hypothetical protein
LTRIVPISAANAAPGAAGEQDRGHQRAELAQHRKADQVGDEDLGAEALHRHRRLEREDQPKQERDQRDDRQAVDPHALADVPDVAPAHRARVAQRVEERRGQLADEFDGSRRRARPCTKLGRSPRAGAARRRRIEVVRRAPSGRTD